MARVSSVTFTINGVNKEYIIHYNKKEKFHIKDFPDEVRVIVRSVVYKEKQIFETENQLIKYYTEFLDEYHDIIQKSRKVIAYSISAPDAFKKLEEVPEEMRTKLGYSGRGENEFGFTIEYDVLLERNHNGLQYFFLDDDGNAREQSHGQHRSIIIDYTPEREKFLSDMKENMKNLFLKVLLVMMDEKKFTEIMDTNSVKLLP